MFIIYIKREVNVYEERKEIISTIFNTCTSIINGIIYGMWFRLSFRRKNFCVCNGFIVGYIIPIWRIC